MPIARSALANGRGEGWPIVGVRIRVRDKQNMRMSVWTVLFRIDVRRAIHGVATLVMSMPPPLCRVAPERVAGEMTRCERAAQPHAARRAAHKASWSADVDTHRTISST